MNRYYQWALAVVSLVIAVVILAFGIAGIAVVIGFLMLPAGIMYIVRGVQNLTHKTKSIINIQLAEHHQLVVHPLWEIAFGVLLLMVGVSLTEAFLGIAVTGIAIYFVIMFLDRRFSGRPGR